MSALIVPLLAQLITVGVTDRTEARYLKPYPYKYEGSTRPGIRLSLAWPRLDVSVGYGASLTLGPLESRPRDLLVYHSASVSSSYRFRHTTLTLSGSGSLGEVNFLAQALRDPTTKQPTAGGAGAPGADNPDQGPSKPAEPTPTPVPPESQPQTTVVNNAVYYGTWNTTAGVGHRVNANLALTGLAVHTVAGGLNDSSRGSYPLASGTTIGVSGSYLLPWSARDSFSSLAALQQAWSSLGGRVTSLLANETWTHLFGLRTSSTLGVGLSVTRTPLYPIYTIYSVYPTAMAALSHETRLARGMLSMGVGAYSAPTLDPLRATVDPRVGATASIGWVKGDFSTRLAGAAAISIARRGNDAGAFDSTQASAIMAYRIADWLSADLGGRLAQQSYRGTTTVPLTYAAFIGMTFDGEVPLNGGKP